MNKIVSIIIPCYNGEQFIDSSIASVYEQDYPNVELIIVDDGSTDKSKDIICSWIDKFCAKGWKLQYVYQDNQGIGAAVNTGLKYVSGDYLTLLDADDRFLPASLKLRAMFLEDHPDYSGVRSNGWRVEGSGRSLFVTDEKEKMISDLFSALTEGKTNNWAGTYLIRTTVLFDVYPDRNIYPSRAGQNFQLLLPVAYRRKFGFIDEPLMEYNLRENSLSQVSSLDARFEFNMRNAEGWRDIYINTIRTFISDPSEIALSIRKYDATFHRTAIYRAIICDKPDCIKEHYRKLCATGFVTINDKVEYFTATHSWLAILFRIVRKLRNILSIH